MANNIKKPKTKKTVSFMGIPRYVMDTQAYKSLRGNSVKLLNELAYQYKGKNNGDLVITHSLLKDCFKSDQTMYRARDELEKKGFIVLNSNGGRSWGGEKYPSLYALTWLPVQDFINLEKNKRRATKLILGKTYKYFINGVNPQFKNSAQKKIQFRKDVKRANIE